MYEERHDMSKANRQLMIELENVDKFLNIMSHVLRPGTYEPWVPGP